MTAQTLYLGLVLIVFAAFAVSLLTVSVWSKLDGK